MRISRDQKLIQVNKEFDLPYAQNLLKYASLRIMDGI